MNNEVWKPIPSYPGYEASNYGRVRGINRIDGQGRNWKGQIIKCGKRGYDKRPGICLRKGGKTYSRYIHQLIAEAFLGSCPKGHIVNHKNWDVTDNKPENLEYVTKSESVIHRQPQRNNTSGYRGVRKNGSGWAAIIWKDRISYYLGTFRTKEEAAQAYNDAAVRFHGRFARINHIP